MNTALAPACIRLNAADNVVIARADLAAGTPVEGITATALVPCGHKLATARIPRGEAVRKYGQIIGFASTDIRPGDHVHTHNVAFGDFDRDCAFGRYGQVLVLGDDRSGHRV